MQHRPALIGALAAELAVGLLAAASPAAATKPEPSPAEPASPDVPLPVRNGHTDVPLPDPLPDVSLPVEVALPVRTGRAGDVPDDPPAPPSPPTPEPAAPAEPQAPSARDLPSPAPAAPAPTTPSVPTPESPPAASAPPPAHTVALGDSLWEIAAGQLASATGRDRAVLNAPEIAGYWVRLCETNRPRLLSGDLNLIYAGEVVELPPV